MSNTGPLEEEFLEKINYIKMLIRDGHVADGLKRIEEMEQQYGPDFTSLPPSVRYLIPFCKGRAYLQMKQPNLAGPELETALGLTELGTEADARSRNLLGVVHYMQEQPSLALRYHLACIHTIAMLRIKDHNFRLSVYQNLANDYWALNDVPNAISAYKEALRILKDLDDPERQADIFWGLALAYKSIQQWRYARLFVARAIEVFRSTGNVVAEAAMCINLADILIEEGRIVEVQPWLDKAASTLSGTDDHGALSFLHRYYAELDRLRGDLGEASLHAAKSIQHAELLIESRQSASHHLWIDPYRAYAESLHGAALIKEEEGDPQAADQLFDLAFQQLSKITVWEIKRAIHLSYAAILKDRGDYERAVIHYKEANQPEA
jgi:tetratricopeptide (TPR) repeat protein